MQRAPVWRSVTRNCLGSPAVSHHVGVFLSALRSPLLCGVQSKKRTYSGASRERKSSSSPTLTRTTSPALAGPTSAASPSDGDKNQVLLTIIQQPWRHLDSLWYAWASLLFSLGIYRVSSLLPSSPLLHRRGTGKPGSLIKTDKGHPNSSETSSRLLTLSLDIPKKTQRTLLFRMNTCSPFTGHTRLQRNLD